MKIKKILSLFLSVASLNLSTNFSQCFGMKPDNYSVTEVEIPGFTNCPKCGATRSNKRKINGAFSTECPHCGSIGTGLVKRKMRNKQYKNKTSDVYACKFCGSQRKKCTVKAVDPEKNAYQCLNCFKCGYESSFCTPYINQFWKRNFCNCKSCSGLIVDVRTLIRKDAVTNQKIPKEQIIKSIICDPNGFDYYCYACQKLNHITLTKEQSQRVCAEYYFLL